jgi:hypothetical protein
VRPEGVATEPRFSSNVLYIHFPVVAGAIRRFIFHQADDQAIAAGHGAELTLCAVDNHNVSDP